MKNCFLTAVFYRIAHHCGRKKAAVPVGHRLLAIAHHIIRDGPEYWEQGGDYFDPERTEQWLSRRLSQIGYNVILTRRPELSPVEAHTRRRGRPCKMCRTGNCLYSSAPAGCQTSAADSIARLLAMREMGIPCIHTRPHQTPKIQHLFSASGAESMV